MTTIQVWDGDRLVAEAAPGKLSVYIYGMGLVAQSVKSGASSTTTAVSYFMDNGMGNVLRTTDTSGKAVETGNYMYDAFGQRHDSLSVSPAFGYRGQYLDAETGNYYLRARYYDPALGRFTQQDSHWNVSNMVYGDSPSNLLGQDIEPYAPRMGIISQAGNLYVYCVNNPLMYADTGGEFIIGALFGSATGAIGGAISALFQGKNVKNAAIAGAIGGAVTGGFIEIGLALAALTGGVSTPASVAISAVGAAVGSFTSSCIEQRLNGTDVDYKAALKSAGISAIFGGLTAPITSMVSTALGNPSTYDSLLNAIKGALSASGIGAQAYNSIISTSAEILKSIAETFASLV